MNPNSHEYRQLADLFHRRGDGFLLDSDLPELAKIDRLFPCLVRCGGCRFTCAAQDVSHLVGIVTKEGSDYVRDVSMMMNPPPPKPGPYGSWERVPFTVPTGGIANTDPMVMTKTNFEAWFACLTDGPDKDEIRRKRNFIEDMARKELAKLEEAAKPVRRDYFGPNGPTGHGDICHSDADRGL